jgi:hypothetical protein
MMNDRPEPRQDAAREGLCASCRFREEVASDRGSRFVRCARARTDARFPKYPPLPVLACIGYDPRGCATMT